MQPPPTLHMGLHLTREPHVLLRFCLSNTPPANPLSSHGNRGQIRAPLLRFYASKLLCFLASFHGEARGSHYTTPRVCMYDADVTHGNKLRGLP